MQEKKRIEYMIEKYTDEYSCLPKGSIYEKRVGEKVYYYLKYRDGKKVISQYISKDCIEEVGSKVQKRKHVEAMIKSLKKELDIANRILEAELWFCIMEAILL